MATSRWSSSDEVPRGATYDERWARLAASGTAIHGEVDLVAEVAPGPRILDAGCGTGRVAVELSRRGFAVTGVDLDEPMLAEARRKAPELPWIEADLVSLALAERFHAVVLAGNVLVFVDPGTEATVVARCAEHLEAGGLLIAGFQVHRDGYRPADLDDHAVTAGLDLVDRWSTWDRQPFHPGGDYQVSVHRRR